MTRKLTRQLGGMLGLVLAVSPCASGQERFAIEQLVPGVFVATPESGTMAGANAVFLLGESDLVVVDTHMTPRSSRALIEEIRRRSTLPVRYVIHTHWHPDHTQGSLSYRESYPAAVVISQEQTRRDIASLGASRLESDRKSWPQRIARLERELDGLSPGQSSKRKALDATIGRERAFLAELNQLRLVLPDITFSRSLHLGRAGQRLVLLFFGLGHTAGDAVVYLPSERVAIVGDLVTGGPPFVRDGFPSAWVETLSRLEELDVDWVIPGHGRVRKGNGIFAERRRFLEAALETTRRGLASGYSTEAIAESIDLESFRDTFDEEPPHRPWRGWMRMIVDRFVEERKLETQERRSR